MKLNNFFSNKLDRPLQTKLIIIIVGFPIFWGIVKLLSSNPEFIQTFYQSYIFQTFTSILKFVTGFTYLSVGELLLYILFVLLIVSQIINIRKVVLKKIRFKRLMFTGLLNLFSTLVLVYFFFQLFFGINYYKSPLSSQLSYPVDSIQKTELIEIVEILTAKTNELRENFNEDDSLVAILQNDINHYLKSAKAGYEAAQNLYKINTPNTFKAKKFLFPSIFSYFGVGGVYSPFTAEANVNCAQPDPFLPAIICHELAHLSGYASEDEANYISFITSKMHPNPEFQYSGYLMALRYSLNQLAMADREKYKVATEKLHPGIKRDIKAYYRYWRKFQTPVEKVSSKIYDQYLKSQDQHEGIMSYHAVVELLVGEYRKFGSL